jgi:hypothetical protein
MRHNPAVESSESIVELILRVASGVTMVVAAAATLLAALWVATDADSDGSWWPVLPWAIITVIALALFVVLLARSRARHASH